MVKAIIFDLDDTLLWDEKSVKKAFEQTCSLAKEKYGVDPERLEEAVREAAKHLYPTYETYPFVKNIGIGVFEAFWGEFKDEGEDFKALRQIVPAYRKEAWTKGLEKLGVHDVALGQEMAETFPKERRKHIYLYEDTLDVLNTLQGKYKLALLTNGSPDLQHEKLSFSKELVPYFEQIVISGDFGKGKPSKEIFAHVLNLLDVDRDEAVMVGDNPMTDILGATKLGMTSVWINHHNRKLEDVKPTYEISRLQELLPIIERL
ncbi:MAG TPA: HAD family hydrolase [Cerasibacillus sp.]|uniref:HAD family hydrolase n=1 Tax=Cerasibacillus sp. TaxID=2498711 RepID=UPI002F3EC048